MKYEVEQKFPVEDLAGIEQRLIALGAESQGEISQVDRYYNHPARDFAATDEAFRIRQVGELNLVTYKGPKIDTETKTRREIEFSFGQGSSHADSMNELLVALGFRPVAVVRKCRQQLALRWRGADVEAALDRVDDVGSFVELEIATGQGGLDTAKQQLLELAGELGLTTSERRSYLELLMEAKGDQR